MSICFLSLETNKVFNELILKKLEKEDFDGLSSSLITIFPFIEEYENISISNLAKKLGYTRQAMHKNLKKLENFEYITFESLENKKEKVVKFTSKGQKLLAIANEYILEIQDDLESNLGHEAIQEYIKSQKMIFEILNKKLDM